MNTTVNALKALYLSFGGASSDVENITTIPDMIDALSELEKTGGTLIATDDGSGHVKIEIG